MQLNKSKRVTRGCAAVTCFNHSSICLSRIRYRVKNARIEVPLPRCWRSVKAVSTESPLVLFAHNYTSAQNTLGGEPRRERCGGVCYRYRATWPRGDRDNASPPLLSGRRFACFGYPYLRTYLPTFVFVDTADAISPNRLIFSRHLATQPFGKLHGKRDR